MAHSVRNHPTIDLFSLFEEEESNSANGIPLICIYFSAKIKVKSRKGVFFF